MASSLPAHPSLDLLRDEARAVAAGPRPPQDALGAVARRYGFPDWSALEHYLDVAAPLTVDPGRVDEDELPAADRFCALASLRYDHSDAPPRWEAAAATLRADGDLPDRHVWAAASAGDPAALRRHLADDPAAAVAHGGPFGWQPLLYLCYSRAPLGRPPADLLAAAGVLLDAGADPNAGYLGCGLATPFTALTGVYGEGEMGARRQPRHPAGAAMAALLLERGAHPVDHQTLYNRMFRPDDDHLEQLFAHGLGDAGPSPWESALGDAMETRSQMWQRQIDWAAAHGFADRLALLAARGIGPGTVAAAPSLDPLARDPDGATALHRAAWDGDLETIRRLLDAGADPTVTDTRFGSTPLGWAEHAFQTEAADLLRAHPSSS